MLSIWGIVTLQNEKRGDPYRVHLWRVDYTRAAGMDYREPLKGLLGIKTSSWSEHTRDDPSKALESRCKILANHRGRLLGIPPIDNERRQCHWLAAIYEERHPRSEAWTGFALFEGMGNRTFIHGL